MPTYKDTASNRKLNRVGKYYKSNLSWRWEDEHSHQTTEGSWSEAKKRDKEGLASNSPPKKKAPKKKIKFNVRPQGTFEKEREEKKRLERLQKLGDYSSVFTQQIIDNSWGFEKGDFDDMFKHTDHLLIKHKSPPKKLKFKPKKPSKPPNLANKPKGAFVKGKYKLKEKND